MPLTVWRTLDSSAPQLASVSVCGCSETVQFTTFAHQVSVERHQWEAVSGWANTCPPLPEPGQLSTAALQTYLLLAPSNTDTARHRLHTDAQRSQHTQNSACSLNKQQTHNLTFCTHICRLTLLQRTHTGIIHEGVGRAGQHTAHINNELTRRTHNSAH